MSTNWDYWINDKYQEQPISERDRDRLKRDLKDLLKNISNAVRDWKIEEEIDAGEVVSFLKDIYSDVETITDKYEMFVDDLSTNHKTMIEYVEFYKDYACLYFDDNDPVPIFASSAQTIDEMKDWSREHCKTGYFQRVIGDGRKALYFVDDPAERVLFDLKWKGANGQYD